MPSRAVGRGQLKSSPDAVSRRMAKAVGHSTRLKILRVLNERVASPSQIAEETGVALGQICYHVEVLRDLDYIELVEVRKHRRGPQHFYVASHRAIVPESAWSELPENVKRDLATEAFRLIVKEAEEAIETGSFMDRPESHLSRTPVVVDEKGWKDIARLFAETLARTMEIEGEAANRLVDQSVARISVTAALAAFESASTA